MTKSTRQQSYLNALEQGATQQQARELAGGVARSTVKRWRDRDPRFAKQEAALLRTPPPEDAPAPTDRPAPNFSPNFSANAEATRATTRLRHLQADKIERDLRLDDGYLIWRHDAEEVLQNLFDRLDLMVGEAHWVRMEQFYDVPFSESRDYFCAEIQALLKYANGWLESRNSVRLVPSDTALNPSSRSEDD